MTNYGAGPKPRVSAKVPRIAIERIMGGVHVGTPPREVEKMIRARIERLRREHPSKSDQWTPAMVRQTVKYALWVHRRNLGEYRWVMGGYVERFDANE